VNGDRVEPDETIVHIVRPAEWAQGQQHGAYYAATLATDGFIHCSRPRQVLGVAQAFFSGERNLLLIGIDSARVEAPIRHEGIEGGDRYPHIYGPLNLNAVRFVTTLAVDSDGAFVLPSAITELLPA
jgi:uncharacterized protein (DUF952 family)